ncbi:MAG TPA: hypothetical protein VIQ30_00285 [Pseudonocardia sp.]
MYVSTTPSSTDLLLETAVLHSLRANYGTTKIEKEVARVALDATCLALYIARHNALPSMAELVAVQDEVTAATDNAMHEANGLVMAAIRAQETTVQAFVWLLPTS